MSTRRDILEQVKNGSLSPEEAAEELERIERTPPAPRVTPDAPAAPLPPVPPVPPMGAARRIKIIGDFRTAKIAGDASVAEAVAEGTHTAHREGETLVIDAGIGDAGEGGEGFSFRRGQRPGIVIGVGGKPKPVSVRMNPELPLDVRIDAGTVHISGVRSEISGEVDAGAIKIEDVANPFDISVDAGSISVSGVIRTGESRIRCDAGAIKVTLKPGSSVKVRARADVGAVRLGRDQSKRGFHIGGSTEEAVFGRGDASLEITGSLGRIVVEEE